MNEIIKDPTEFKEKLSIEAIFLRQLQRCLELQAYDADSPNFQSSINGLLCVAPRAVREAVKARQAEYEEEVYRFDYRYFCGKPIGTPAAPAMQENWDKGEAYPIPYVEVKGEDGEKRQEINWDDPHIRSPTRHLETITNWDTLLMIIGEEAENYSLSWKPGSRRRSKQ